jgi:hypothetical protein
MGATQEPGRATASATRPTILVRTLWRRVGWSSVDLLDLLNRRLEQFGRLRLLRAEPLAFGFSAGRRYVAFATASARSRRRRIPASPVRSPSRSRRSVPRRYGPTRREQVNRGSRHFGFGPASARSEFAFFKSLDVRRRSQAPRASLTPRSNLRNLRCVSSVGGRLRLVVMRARVGDGDVRVRA